jgi:hypothetical protein
LYNTYRAARATAAYTDLTTTAMVEGLDVAADVAAVTRLVPLRAIKPQFKAPIKTRTRATTYNFPFGFINIIIYRKKIFYIKKIKC